MNFVEAMTAAQAGYDTWAAKPHNAKWFRRIDGTPIPNDLVVCIAQAFSASLASPPPVAEGEAQPVATRSMTPTPETSLPAPDRVTEAKLIERLKSLQIGTEKRYSLEGDMWFFELWRALGEAVAALTQLPAPVGGEVTLMRKAYDVKCLELANHFDAGDAASDLAQTIQNAIEDWFADHEGKDQ